MALQKDSKWIPTLMKTLTNNHLFVGIHSNLHSPFLQFWVNVMIIFYFACRAVCSKGPWSIVWCRTTTGSELFLRFLASSSVGFSFHNQRNKSVNLVLNLSEISLTKKFEKYSKNLMTFMEVLIFVVLCFTVRTAYKPSQIVRKMLPIGIPIRQPIRNGV